MGIQSSSIRFSAASARRHGESARVKNIVVELRCAVVQPHPNAIGGRFNSSTWASTRFAANMALKYPHHFGGIEVVADKPRRLEAVQEFRAVASPTQKRPFFNVAPQRSARSGNPSP